MQNVIVGTAGHVDHGKTCLIRALTGIDTDRLKEEKKRGITIELGFASLPNAGGLQIGIIDVPGHERFVKNMLAGIGGIDLVLLVIAMDEGVMPQTTEHFEILKMLHIKRGIVVFTKADLADEEWAMMVEEDARELVAGSFLEHAPTVRVSAYTGENIELLKKMILELARETEARRTEKELFRLPADRVFTMEGFGTVITGTLMEGACALGQEVMIYPEERTVRIRGIQNHGESGEEALAGQRTALNLTGIKKEELSRGAVLAAPGSILTGRLADGRVRLFSDTERRLKSGDRVHISYGAAQAIGKAVLLDRDEIGAAEEAYVQFRFDEPIAVKSGDCFIIRFYSPVETFGGGVFLEADAPKHKRGQEEILRGLSVKESGSGEEALETVIKELSARAPELQELAVRRSLTLLETSAMLEKLKKQKKVLSIGQYGYMHREYWERIVAEAEKILTEFHKKNPILDGMEREEFKNRLGKAFHMGGRLQDELLPELIKRRIATVRESVVALDSFSSSYSDELAGMRMEIEELYRSAGVDVPANTEVTGRFGDKKQAAQIMADLAKTGVLIKINPSSYMAREHWERALSEMETHYRTHETMTLAEFRDLLGTSRKYAVMLLEAYDQKKITRMTGDTRTLIKK